MRSRWLLTPVVAVFLGAITWSALASSATAVPTDSSTPGPTGSSTIGFTVTSTSTPTPSPTGSGGGGGTGGGGTTPPKCVPNKTAVTLSPVPISASLAKTLQLSKHRVAQGDDVLVQGDGFKPNEKVVIGLYSSPVKLGVSTIRTNGQLYADVTIPKKTQLGTHTIQVQGYIDCRVAAANLSVVSPRGSGSSAFPWIVWLIVGGTVGLSAVGLLVYLAIGGVTRVASIGVTAGASP